VRVESLHTFITGDARTWTFLLLGAVACVLLIASVNLATLMLVRATTRGRELGIRSALGASRWDLVRTLVVESLVLSLTGATLGVLVAWIGVDFLRAAMPAEVPRVATIGVNLRVLGATMTTAIVTGLTFGLAPIVQFSRTKSSPLLHDRGRANTASVDRQRLRTALVVTEVALAVMLLVGSGLFLASFEAVTHVDLGVDVRNVLTIRIRPLVGPAELQGALQRHRGLLLEVLDRARAIPGVEVASLLDGGLPFRGDLKTADLTIPGRTDGTKEDIDRNQITPDYFRALRVPLRQGRFFTNEDRQGSEPVVILNAAAAEKYFPSDDPIGQVVNLEGVRRIIGVVGNIRHDGPETDLRREAFVPLAQSHVIAATLVLRTSRPTAAVLPEIKAAIWSQFPDLALPDIKMLGGYVDALTAQRRVNMLLIGLFGLLGLAIAAVGIYGVMAYIVTQRTQEIGIRMALGAWPALILWSVLGRASRQLGLGLAIGLLGAWVLSGLVEEFLFRVPPHDIVVYAGSGALILLVGLLAALLPAHRAARVEPIIALRRE
jgi:putative ABC transport system permease protein